MIFKTVTICMVLTNLLPLAMCACAKGNKFVLCGVQSTNRLLIGSFEYYKSQKVINKRYANIGTSMQSVRKSVIRLYSIGARTHMYTHIVIRSRCASTRL